ncbi:glycosyltransferase family 2 protein [Fodinicola feengrottensis]|uniref:glycosyltransferase family 2 protein n=1 Tax=Fodinicola feengrottensis TaxID=435914 RepID=UPI0024422D38|nr:glycosyltransferase [Fodinicola feengrottensis]
MTAANRKSGWRRSSRRWGRTGRWWSSRTTVRPASPAPANAGVAASSGQLLAFCDDDDSWRPDKLSRQIALLQQGNHDLVVCGIEIRYGTGKQERTHVRIPRQEDLTLAELARRRVMEAHPSTVLVTREAFALLVRWTKKLPGSYAEDYDWMLRAVAHSSVGTVPEPLVHVLWHRGSYFADRWQTIIDALDYCVDKHPALRNSSRGLSRIYGQKAFAYAALGQRADARRWAIRSLRLHPTEQRSYLAILVSARVVSAATVLHLAHTAGRGI